VALKDPIRVIDRRGLKNADMGAVSRAVQSDLRDMSRALKERFGESFDPTTFPIPDLETIAGQASNVRAWLMNESRRAKETIVDFTTAGATQATAIHWARSIQFQKGILDLSVTSHPRALQRLSILDFAEGANIEHLGMLMPSLSESMMTPGGLLSKHVGRIRTVAEWQAISKATNKDRRGLSLIFTLGMHHGDPHQMIPVPKRLLLAAFAEMKRYRDGLIRRINRRWGV